MAQIRLCFYQSLNDFIQVYPASGNPEVKLPLQLRPESPYPRLFMVDANLGRG
jgi:hypothetical protein